MPYSQGPQGGARVEGANLKGKAAGPRRERVSGAEAGFSRALNVQAKAWTYLRSKGNDKDRSRSFDCGGKCAASLRMTILRLGTETKYADL